MDLKLNTDTAFEADAPGGGMPPEAPVSMPPQDLRYKPWRTERHLISPAVLYARFILIAVTLGVTTYGVYQMLQVVRFASMTLLQGTMIFFFAISLGWIAFSAGSVLAGASKRRDALAPGPAAAGAALTALVMPIYNEDPARTAAGLQAMAEALRRIDAHRGFEIVMLSDSTDADAWIRETLQVARLRAALHSHHAGLVSAALAEHRAQIGQSRGLRNALGWALRTHDRARCRQPHRCTHAPAAGPGDARRIPSWASCKPRRS